MSESLPVIRPTPRAAAAPSRPRQTLQPTLVGPAGKVADQPPVESAPIEVVAPEEDAIQFWITKISESIGNVAGWCILTGQELLAAKKQLGHGNWSKLFEPGGLKFSLRTAEILMAVPGPLAPGQLQRPQRREGLGILDQ